MFDVRTALAQPVGLTRWQRLVLCAFVLVCLAVRLWWGIGYPAMIYPDNIYQSIEQAHRLVFGFGVAVPEYHLGMRNWLFPGMLAGIMRVCRVFSDSAVVYLAVIKGVVSAFSMLPVFVTYKLARRIAPFWMALVVTCLPAFWYEAVLFAPTTFFGAFAANLFVLACYWLMSLGGAHDTNRRAIAAGIVLAVVSIVRFHLLPSVLFVLIYAAYCRPERRRALWLSFCGGFIALGMLDWWTWSYPFQSVIANIQYNIIQHKASNQFGHQPWYEYAVLLWRHLYIFIVPIVLIIVATARRYPLLLGALLINVVSFSLVGHKEYRFIFLAVTLWPILVALGMAELMQRSQRWRRWMVAVLVLMLVVAPIPAAMLYMRHLVHGQVLRASLQAGEWARQRAGGRVRALVADSRGGHGLTDFYQLGGYSYFNVDVPFEVRDFAGLRLVGPALSQPIVLITDNPIDIKGVDKLFCKGRYCVYSTHKRVRWQ